MLVVKKEMMLKNYALFHQCALKPGKQYISLRCASIWKNIFYRTIQVNVSWYDTYNAGKVEELKQLSQPK